MSFEASVVGACISAVLRNFFSSHRLGLISGSDGFFHLQTTTRGPDVAFIEKRRLPGGGFPSQTYPSLSPNLVVEVLGPGNTKAEMARKRLEYFHAGVELIWIVDCRNRSVAVYTSPGEYTIVGEEEILNGGTVLPGFKCPVADIFSDLDIGQES